MKIREAIRLVAGSVAVYGLVAACGAASEQLESRARGDAGGETDNPSEGGGGSLLDAIADAITDPVKDAAADQPISGSRLKAEYIKGDDGSRHFYRWFDTERQEACSFVADQTGQQRCVSVERIAATLPDTWFDSTVSDCSDRSTGKVISLPKGEPLPKYVTVLGATGNEVWTVVPYTQQLHLFAAGVCQAASQNPTLQYVVLNEKVQPGAFVKGTVERDP